MCPSRDVGTFTTWDYNADDTIQKITDARSASKIITYNARHLVTGISYNAPAPILIPAAVSYGYDDAGNRISMTDEVGTASYNYDQLSRLMSESRTFGTVGPLAVSYEYNLAGQLKKIIDPSNMAIAYSYDQVGRNTAVTGENTLYAGVSQYASNLTYRAWGAVKGMTYGNNYTYSMSFNARLLPSLFEVAKPPQSGSSVVMKTQYQYYADASLKFADRLTTLGQGFDRAFSYDQVSMLKEAYSGGEARDYVNGTTGGAPGPYRQSYQHDVFGNLTNRASNYWGHDDPFSATYLNNRRQDPAWQFDADGRLKQDGNLQYTYDASGDNRSIFNPESNTTTTLIPDGDGRQIKRVDAPSGTSVTTYYLRSSVLEGRIIAELNSSGQKHKGYVFARGEVLASQEFGAVTWQHADPLTGSAGQSIQNGTFTSTAELDPSGINIGATNPFVNPPEFSPEPFLPMLTGDEGSCGSNPNCVRCSFHGSEIPCSIAGNMMGSGFASVDPLRTSASTLEKLAAQPIFGLFCVDTPTAAVGATAPSTAVGMGATTSTSPGSGAGRTCTRELVGYTEGTMASGMNLIPLQPQNSQDARLADAQAELRRLLQANDGNNPCAKFFGGLKNALEKLDKSNIGFRSMGGPISLDGLTVAPLTLRDAVTNGKNITINSDGRFMANNGTLPIMGRPGMVANNVNYYDLNDIGSAAFILAHELGHRAGKLENDSVKAKDPEGATARNNTRVYEACFKN